MAFWPEMWGYSSLNVQFTAMLRSGMCQIYWHFKGKQKGTVMFETEGHLANMVIAHLCEHTVVHK